MENIKISIIIPVYNTEKYLRKCLESVVNQTLKDIEIICVNDGSTDNSLKILEEFARLDKRIILKSQKNKGQAFARNLGLDIAKGEYIGFVDSDDWIDLDYFEKMYAAAKKHNADLTCCSIKRIYPFKQSWRIKVIKEEVFDSVEEKYNFAQVPKQCYPVNKIFKRSELLKHNLRFPEGRYFEDIAFTMRALFYLEKMVTVPNITYWYWANMNSTVKNKNDKKQTDLIAAWADFRSFTRENFIKCDEKYYVIHKHQYKFLGFTILKIYEWETISKYYLFGFIKFMEKYTYTS